MSPSPLGLPQLPPQGQEPELPTSEGTALGEGTSRSELAGSRATQAQSTHTGENVERPEPHSLRGDRVVRPLWRTVWWLFTKLNILLACDAAIMFPGICPKEQKTYP